MERKKHSCIVVGIGNPMLKDDRVGLEVVQTLETLNVPVDTAELYSVGFDVLDTIMGYESAVIVDACQMGYPACTIVEMTPDELFSDELVANSHAVTLGSTLRTGQMVFPDDMPSDVKLVLVEAKGISYFSKECSPKVAQAVHTIVQKMSATEVA